MPTLPWLWSFRSKLQEEIEEESEKENGEQWTQARKAGTSKQTNKAKGKGGNPETGGPSTWKSLTKDQVTTNANTLENPFAAIDPPDDQPELEEGEVQQNKEQTVDTEINLGSHEQTIEDISETPCEDTIQQEKQGPLVGTTSPPSYAEMTKKKKLIDNPGSSVR